MFYGRSTYADKELLPADDEGSGDTGWGRVVLWNGSPIWWKSNKNGLSQSVG